MKTLNLFLLFVCLAFLSACSKKDEVSPSSSNTGILGSWRVSDISYTGKSTVSFLGQEFVSDFTGKGVDMDLTFQFKENPNEFFTKGNYSILLKGSFMGQTTENKMTNAGFVGSGTWSKSGNDILVTNAGQSTTQKFTIVELTASTLKLSFDLVQNATQSGAATKYEVKGTYTFTRM